MRAWFILISCIAFCQNSDLIQPQFSFDDALTNLRKEGIASTEKLLATFTDDSLYVYGIDQVGKTPKKAFAWFDELSRRKPLPRYQYGKAWSLKTLGNNEESRELAESALAQNPSGLVKARLHYLLGLLDLQENKLDASETNTKQSLSLYSELANFGGKHLCYVNLAFVSIKRKDLSGAELYLSMAVKANLKATPPFSTARINELRSSLFWQMQDIKAALQWAEEAKREYYRNGEYKNGWTLQVNVGMFLALQGHLDEAKRIGKDIEALGQGLDDSSVFMQTQLLLIMVDRCKGIDYTLRKTTIEGWSKFKGSDHENTLKWIESRDCQ